MLYKIRRTDHLQEWLRFVLQMTALGLFLFILHTAVFGFAVVHGDSMKDTLEEKDLLVYSKLGYEPGRGDIVICRTGKGYENTLVKRIIGIPGDQITIDAQSGMVYVNEEPVPEEYCIRAEGPFGDMQYPVIVPDKQYFVLGDNREVSLDSRYSEIGTVSLEKIDGHVLFRLFPFSKIKTFK